MKKLLPYHLVSSPSICLLPPQILDMPKIPDILNMNRDISWMHTLSNSLFLVQYWLCKETRALTYLSDPITSYCVWEALWE